MSNFPNSRLKIDRAYTHIDELEALAAWYCSPDLHRTIADNNSAGSSKLILQSEPIPPQTALIVGDAIHCLRAALDHAAYTMTTGKAKKEFISFPFGERLIDLKSTVKGGAISVAGPAITDTIIHKIKPYRIDHDTGEHGNVALWMMNKLDNVDKHREILLTTSIIETHVEKLSFPVQHNIICQNNTFITKGGHNGPVFEIGGTKIIGGQGATTVDIIFAEREFFHGEPVIPTLHQLAELTASAIDILEPLA